MSTDRTPTRTGKNTESKLTNGNKELRPSHTAAILRTISITTHRGRFVLVELLHAEYAHAHSANGTRSLCVVIVIVLVIVIAAVGPGLYIKYNFLTRK